MNHLDYLKIGWSLLPMQFVKESEGGFSKKPTIKWKGFQSTPPTLDEVDGWLAKNWFLGIVCGQLSGITIIDDDRIKHRLPEWGIQSSVIAKTKSGGKHYYFRHNGENNTVNKELFLDIRGQGGYAVLPPYNDYSWISPPSVENLAQLNVIPEDLKYLIYPKSTIQEQRHVNLDEVWGADQGNRDQALFEIGMHFCHKLPEQYWSEVRNIMHLSNQQSDRPLDSKTVDEKYVQAMRYARENKKKEITSDIITPQSFQEVATRRIEDRKLERIAPSTGYLDLDRAIRGFIPGRLMALSGDTNIGKSGLAANFAYNVASQGQKALYFALEPDRVITEYFISIKLDKRFDLIEDSDLQTSINGIDIVTGSQIKTSTELANQILSLPRYNLIIIDHLGYFTGDGDNQYRTESIILKELAQTAQEKMSTIIVICHLNKTFDVTEKNWIPKMNQISGSAAFKQDCDEVLLLGKKPIETEYGNIKYGDFGVIVVGKTKSGGDGSVCPLRFQPYKALINGIHSKTNFVAEF